MLFTGCVLTSLTLNGDIAEESGRIKMSGTFKTGMKPAFDSDLNPTSTAHFNTNYFATDYGDDADTNAVTVIAGVADPIMKSFSCTLKTMLSLWDSMQSGRLSNYCKSFTRSVCNI